MITNVTKNDIMRLTGYSESQSKKLIRIAKAKLVAEGFDWYDNKRVGRVPIKTVELILGFELFPQNDIIGSVQEDTAILKGVQNDSN